MSANHPSDKPDGTTEHAASLDNETSDTKSLIPPTLPSTDTETYLSGPFHGLTKNVIRMGWVSFFADVAGELLYPITPLFLTVVLGSPIWVVGLIEGIAEATASFMKTVFGRLSDKTGKRKPFVFGGYTLSAFAKPLIAVASGWVLVLIARVLDRFGKGLRTSPRDALLADSVDAAYRGRAFGWHRAMDTSGAVLGPLVALAALWYLQHHMAFTLNQTLRLIFLIAFIPGILGALLVLFVRERAHIVEPKSLPPLQYRALPPAFRGYLLAWGVFSIANSSDVFLILRARDTMARSMSDASATTFVILLYVLYNFIYAAASPYLGHLSDKIDRKKVLAGGLLVFAIVYGGFAIATQAWVIWALFAVYGLYTAATDGVGKALAVDLAPSSMRASALGLLGTLTGIATLAASTIAGLLWTYVHPWAPFLYGAAGALLGALLLLNVKKAEVVE